MSVIEIAAAVARNECGLTADLNSDYRLQIDVLESWLCRVAIVPADKPGGKPWVTNTWMIGPPGESPAWEGRHRLSVEGFSCPPSEFNAETLQLDSEHFQIGLQAKSLAVNISGKSEQGVQSLTCDRPAAAYRTLPARSLIQHAQSRDLTHLHLGLGDKAGKLDRTGKRFRILQLDALGYNAETSDPLYKHVPWIISGNAEQGYSGIFYDSMSEMNIDLGAEHSNYHEHYRHLETYDSALIYYVVQGPGLEELVCRFQSLVGLPHLQPRWSMGFAHTSMHLADDDNAQKRILDFADECRRRQLPISAIHSGSGYTTRDDGRRYVFTWNTKKFPDRDAFFTTLNNAGLKTCANIKPVLLCEHPLYKEVADFRGFILDGNGEPAIEMFWGGPGSSLDFTNPETVKWWQAGVAKQVLGAGFTSTWNDNNECEIWDEDASVNGFGDSLQAMDVRPLQALLMLRASYEVTLEHAPDQRPYLISRAGPVGMSRYAQTWSGDNHTSWHTLQWNLANGLSMSLSGLPYLGHDIGGFDGPKPDAELLCRWVEMMCLHPRAVMNSWKPSEDNPATLPWMHASVENFIIGSLNQRYRFLPWLYHQSWRTHTTGAPCIAPCMLHYQDDALSVDHSSFMVGKEVLVAPVAEQGETMRDVYLPKISGVWYAFSANDSDLKFNETEHAQFAGGQQVSVPAPLGSLPVFVRSGSVIPIAMDWPEASPHDATEVTLTVFVDSGSNKISTELFFDDGESWQYQQQQASLLHVEVQWNENDISVEVHERWTGESRPGMKVAVIGAGKRSINVKLPD